MGDLPQPARKGKKRPKVKGCYECARRRIDCDLQQPACRKCVQKGLSCTSSTIRYRFNDGLAARGKMVGKWVPKTLSYKRTPSLIVMPAKSHDSSDNLPLPTEYNLQHINENENCTALSEFDIQQNLDQELSWLLAPFEIEQGAGHEHLLSLVQCSGQENLPGLGRQTVEDISEVRGDEICAKEPVIEEATDQDALALWIDPGLDHIDGETRWFLQYFSDHVAPITAVIDLGLNGYRDLILPMSEGDALVRKAIRIVAEQHLSLQLGLSDSPRSFLYYSLIRDLIIRSKESPPHQDESSMTALLLLHIREMISGSEDFKLVYGSLRALVRMMGSNSIGLNFTVGNFVRIQLLRVCLFGEALFDEMEGAQFLLTHGENCLEFLRLCSSLHPEFQELMTYLFDMIKLACQIYVQRVVHNPKYDETVSQVECFKKLTSKVERYVDTLGRHLFAWSYFIVASESSTEDHRNFFLEKLESLHRLTKCGNIRKAVEQVKRIWALQSTTRWTSLLGASTQALIM